MNTSPSKKHTVLLLEGHQDCRNATESLLSVYGYVCQQLETIDEAVEAAAAQPDSLVLADYDFGDRTAVELLQRLRNASLRNPVVLMSSLEDVSIREKSINAGASHFFAKPYLPKELLDVLSRLFKD